jgi:hypothetical protein|tara:strand:+ start:100 stop:384 length:285 start_codon:yes stop_codon:yes gene_type:complete
MFLRGVSQGVNTLDDGGTLLIRMRQTLDRDTIAQVTEMVYKTDPKMTFQQMALTGPQGDPGAVGYLVFRKGGGNVAQGRLGIAEAAARKASPRL